MHTHWTASYHDYIQHQGTFTTSGGTAQHHLGKFVRPSGPNFISSGNMVGPAWGKAVSANISLSIGYGHHHDNLKARNQPFLHGAILATVTWLFLFLWSDEGVPVALTGMGHTFTL